MMTMSVLFLDEEEHEDQFRRYLTDTSLQGSEWRRTQPHCSSRIATLDSLESVLPARPCVPPLLELLSQ